MQRLSIREMSDPRLDAARTLAYTKGAWSTFAACSREQERRSAWSVVTRTCPDLDTCLRMRDYARGVLREAWETRIAALREEAA